MILSLLLPIAMPIIAVICLLGALYPSRLSRVLLFATAGVLLCLTVWYVVVFFFGGL